MCDGAIIPCEQVVPLLKAAMLDNLSENYIIDGFPRTVEQAQMFEQQVCEIQTIIHLETSPEQMLERLTEVCNTSDRIDHSIDIIKKKISQYSDQTVATYEYYAQFGKMRTINLTDDFSRDYNCLLEAMMPQCMFMVGPKCSGKTTIGSHAAMRTNMKLLNFNSFLKSKGLKNKDDETIVLSLINSMVYESEPRLMIENFPQNTT